MESYTTWLRLSRDGNVTSWQQMEINDDWWYSKGASACFLPPLHTSHHCVTELGQINYFSN